MSDIKCLSNKNNKAYVVPTNKWLKPLKPLFFESSDADIMLAKLVDKEEVLVRITKNNNNKLEIINNNLSKLENFPFIYCIIKCNENIDILDNKFLLNDKPVNGFCNGNKKDQQITLEIMKHRKKSKIFSEHYFIKEKQIFFLIMKYYKKNYIQKLLDKKIDIDTLKLFLDQSISAQLLALQNFGFVHGDIHINNILINKEEYEYKYEFDRKLYYKSITGKINFKIYLVDFGNSEFLLPEYRSQYINDYYDENKIPKRKYREEFNTLPQNIYDTFKTLFKLLNDNDRGKLIKILENHKTEGNPTLDYYNYLFYKGQSKLFSTYDKEDQYFYIKRSLCKTILMVNQYYTSLFGVDYIIHKE
jgi:hypothetical protein